MVVRFELKTLIKPSIYQIAEIWEHKPFNTCTFQSDYDFTYVACFEKLPLKPCVSLPATTDNPGRWVWCVSHIYDGYELIRAPNKKKTYDIKRAFLNK